jgi:hypothetical protein
MEKIQSKYVIFNHSDNSLTVLQDEEDLSFRPICDDVFENATIVFNDNNSITLEGDCWQYGLSLNDVYPSELSYEVHPKYIKKTRFLKKDIIRTGWHRKKDNIKTKVIMSKYKIIE